MNLIKIAIIFLFSCSSKSNNISIVSNKEKVVGYSNEMRLLVQQWHSDSLGCMKLRSKQMAEKIVDSFNLEHAVKADFLKIFGKSNIEKEYEGNIMLQYYFDAICRDGKFIDSADHCIAEFIFSKNKLIQRNYICQ